MVRLRPLLWQHQELLQRQLLATFGAPGSALRSGAGARAAGRNAPSTRSGRDPAASASARGAAVGSAVGVTCVFDEAGGVFIFLYVPILGR